MVAEEYIVDALCTVGSRRTGALGDWHAVNLGAAVVDAMLLHETVASNPRRDQ